MWSRTDRCAVAVALAALLLVELGAGCKGTDPDAAPTPAPDARPEQADGRDIRALLREISERGPIDNPYLERHTLRIHQNELAHLGDDDPLRAWQLHREVGLGEMRLGNVAGAVEHYHAAVATFEELRPLVDAAELDKTELELAFAYLRLAETENCVARHGPDSCIFPIQGSGVHQATRGAEQAVAHLERLLARLPDKVTSIRIKAMWYLNIAYQALGRPEQVPAPYRIDLARLAPADPFPRFVNVAPSIGLARVSLAGSVIVEDFDGDGDLDVFNTTMDVDQEARLYRNRGDGTFADAGPAAGLDGLTGGLNCVPADYDDDGDVDVLVLRGAWYHQAGRHPNSLLQNDGAGRFTDVTFAAGLGEVHYPSQTAAWADYDHDGDLDLYVGNEAVPGEAYPGQLFNNRGNGTFVDVAADAGVENLSYAKGVAWGDFDGDRLPDLFVSNQPFANRLYRNLGGGRFTDVTEGTGVADPVWSFPVWFWDYDNDGRLDLFVAGYLPAVEDVAGPYLGQRSHGEPVHLWRFGSGAKGGAGAADAADNVAAAVALTGSASAMGANFGDLDNDGFPDFYLGTGYPSIDALMPNMMFWNRAGERFDEVTIAGGFGHLQKGHGIAFADIDDDGDQDVVAQMGGFYPVDAFADAVFLNPGFGNNWLKLKLVGTTSNRAAVGAWVRVAVREDGEERSIYSHVGNDGSFGSGPSRLEIGLGRAALADLVEVHWPTSDTVERFRDVAVNRFYRLTEGSGELVEQELKPVAIAP